MLEILLGRDPWIAILLDTMEAGTIGVADLNATKRQRLLTHMDAEIVTRSEKLLAGKVNSDRKGVIDDYRESLRLTGKAERGKGSFCQDMQHLPSVG